MENLKKLSTEKFTVFMAFIIQWQQMILYWLEQMERSGLFAFPDHILQVLKDIMLRYGQLIADATGPISN